uniref:E3 ubiquitin-protein ligase n=1 Tax=Steinernema glaseri TaxID=37863 RepID=A0A1I8A6L2_9BILA
MSRRLPDMSSLFNLGGMGGGAPTSGGGGFGLPQMSAMLGRPLATPLPTPPVQTFFSPVRAGDAARHAEALKEPCCICLTDLDLNDLSDRIVSLNKCTHLFHYSCAKQALENRAQCPRCLVWYHAAVGNQPHGSTMTVGYIKGHRVPGHRDAEGFIVIDYSLPSGVQDETHPRPGHRFHGTHRTAYLPNNAAGQEVLELLRYAFNQRLTFTVGDSVTTGAKDVVTWNGIHHKTSTSHGPFGYPDDTYLTRVKDELAAYGITTDNMRR